MSLQYFLTERQFFFFLGGGGGGGGGIGYWFEEGQKDKIIFINEYSGGVKTEINEKPAFYGKHNSGIRDLSHSFAKEDRHCKIFLPLHCF